jgi:hypothetical protein
MSFQNIVLGLFIAAFGVALFGITWHEAHMVYALTHYGAHADGTVTGMNHSTYIRKGNWSGHYTAVVRFTDSHGQSHSFTDYEKLFNWGRYVKVGEHVKVLYLKDDPENEAKIDYGFMLWANSVLCAVAGLLFVWGGWVKARTGRDLLR